MIDHPSHVVAGTGGVAAAVVIVLRKTDCDVSSQSVDYLSLIFISLQ